MNIDSPGMVGGLILFGFMAYRLWAALTTGSAVVGRDIGSKWRVRRADEPFKFWAYVSVHGLFLAFALVAAIMIFGSKDHHLRPSSPPQAAPLETHG